MLLHTCVHCLHCQTRLVIEEPGPQTFPTKYAFLLAYASYVSMLAIIRTLTDLRIVCCSCMSFIVEAPPLFPMFIYYTSLLDQTMFGPALYSHATAEQRTMWAYCRSMFIKTITIVKGMNTQSLTLLSMVRSCMIAA